MILKQNQYTLQSSSKEMEEINYKGMLQLNSEDVDTLMSRLIVELDPATIIEISPHLPAQILFMCIRYLDKQNYYLTVQAVIENFTKTIRFIIKHRKHFETMILWLANVHELMIYFKQFSKKDLKNLYNYQMCNTNRQAQQCLYNLDLAVEYNSLHELGQWIVKKALKQVKTHMLELIVPGLLENDEIVPLDQDIQESSEQLPLQKLHQLLKEFSCIHESFKKCNLHRKMIMQYFNQLFEFINSIALSNIMSRREMCTSYKGFRIRCNIRHLERWAANHQLLSTIHALRPVIEAARLLQMQLIDQSDIVWISEKFNKLNSNQIIKLLDLFQSNNEQDMKIDNCLLHTQLKERLQRRVELDDTIILQAEKSMINFVFEYSDVCLADIEIPSVFNLTMLKKI